MILTVNDMEDALRAYSVDTCLYFDRHAVACLRYTSVLATLYVRGRRDINDASYEYSAPEISINAVWVKQ